MAKQNKTNAGGDDVLLNINVTGREEITGAVTEAEKLKSTLDGAGKADLSAPPKSLKTQLREATIEAQKLFTAGKQNTQEYANASRKVANLKDDIEQMNNTFKAFDPDNKFRVFANAAGIGAKAVQGYAGAMAFLGVESEDATRTIAKLQGIMAFADAINSLADIKDTYRDLLSVLGLNVTKTKELQVAQTESSAVAVEGALEQLTAEEQLAAARQAYAAADIATQEALQATRVEGIAISEEINGAEQIYLEQAALRQAASEAVAEAEDALTNATQGAAGSTIEAAVATEGLTVAEEGATAASFTLGAALKAIGIGLIISALAYLISNFDKVKQFIVKLFPALGDMGDSFNKIKQIVFGVGNAILEFIIAPIKSLVALIQGDFTGALEALKKGADVVGNFNKGVNDEIKSQNEAARIEKIKGEIELNERLIKERKALGENTYKLEVANAKRRVQVLDKESDDYVKTLAEAESELTIIINSERKRRSDKYKELLKADLESIKANNLDALKIVKTGSTNQRKAEIDDLDLKYNKEIALLKKRKGDLKDYNTQYANLIKARKVEEEGINKKYDTAILAYQSEINQSYFSDFEKKEAEIKKRAEELLKTATPKQAASIIAGKEFQLNANTEQKNKSAADLSAQTSLTAVEDINRPKVTDTPEEARTKIDNLTKARIDAENSAFELKKSQLSAQYDELELLNAQHEKSLTDITDEQAAARKEIAKIEAENRLKLFDALGAGAEAVSGIIGESTLAGKALAVASATISTYSAIAGQLAAFSGVPVPGYAIAQAIATGLVGFANVKKILAVKVPTKSGTSTGGGGSAPVINSTILARESSGSNDVVREVKKSNTDQKTVRAYIVNKDLDEQKAKAAYFNSQQEY